MHGWPARQMPCATVGVGGKETKSRIEQRGKSMSQSKSWQGTGHTHNPRQPPLQTSRKGEEGWREEERQGEPHRGKRGRGEGEKGRQKRTCMQCVWVGVCESVRACVRVCLSPIRSCSLGRRRRRRPLDSTLAHLHAHAPSHGVSHGWIASLHPPFHPSVCLSVCLQRLDTRPANSPSLALTD